MRHPFLRSFLASLPALLLYLAVLPWLALRSDRWLGFAWRLPVWVGPMAVLRMLAGLLLAGSAFWALTFVGRGTPNPLVPTSHLVDIGPFRRSRNPLMLGGWLFGVGLALLLGSPSLLFAVAFIAIVGSLYVRFVEEPGMRARFGDAWQRYANQTPRWFAVHAALPKHR